MIEDAIRSLLIAPASATGAIIGTRCYPERLPQVGGGEPATLPAIVYKLVSAPQEYHHKGPRFLITARIQLDLCTDTYSHAQALRDGIRGRPGHPGVLSGRQATVVFDEAERTVAIRRIFVRMERDSSESDLDNLDASQQTKSLDIEVWFWET